MHPPHLDDAHRALPLLDPARVLRRPGASFCRMPHRRLLRQRLHQLQHLRSPGQRGGLRESGQRLQLLLAHALLPPHPHDPGEPRPRGDDDLLPDRLRPGADPQGHGLLPRPVPPQQSAALRRGLPHPRRGPGSRELRRHLHGLADEQQRLVGRGRDQVLPRRRHRSQALRRQDDRGLHRLPDDLWDGDRGLLLRLVQFRGQGREALPRVHHTLCRRSPRGPAQRALRRQPALFDVPLAHHRPDPFPQGSDGDHPGPGLAQVRPLPAPPGRHRFPVLGSDNDLEIN